VKAQKTVCNSGKTDAGLFKITKEYVLNKNQNILNKLDLTVDGIAFKLTLDICANLWLLLVAKLGKPAVDRI
jgi:hypothetical protein